MAAIDSGDLATLLPTPAESLLSSLPLDAVHDLLSVGVCVQCILRIYGLSSSKITGSCLTASVLHAFLENHAASEKDAQCCCSCKEMDMNGTFCCVCLGALQSTCLATDNAIEGNSGYQSIADFSSMISEFVKKENRQVDCFCLEISLPPVIAANERAIRLYMKQKYEDKQWFKDIFGSKHVSVKDALQMLLTESLQIHLNAKYASSSFSIRLTYTHLEASERLQSYRHEVEIRDCGDVTERSCKRLKESESDAAFHRTLDCMKDENFSTLFRLPPEKVAKPCTVRVSVHQMPIYIGGRYLKFSRNVSQTRWIIDEERMGEASVEEIIGAVVRDVCRADDYKFHAAGREDIDVRMLGSGRPFLIEVSNARNMPHTIDIEQMAERINNSERQYVRVRNLKLVGSEVWNLMREGEAEKQKQYVALIWISRPLLEKDLQNLSTMKDMVISQKTPIRVLHRRSPLERKRIIHWMNIEKTKGSSQYLLLHLCTQAGTYIKEFVHGDLGRTQPSIGSILGCRAEILQLDVTDVKMEFLS